MLLFLAFTAFTYTKIFSFRIKNSRSPLGKQVVNVAERTNASTKARLLKARLLKELKIAKSCFLVVVVSLVCSLHAFTYSEWFHKLGNKLPFRHTSKVVVSFKFVQFNCELSDFFLAQQGTEN
jgi:hypothetical protein